MKKDSRKIQNSEAKNPYRLISRGHRVGKLKKCGIKSNDIQINH